MDPFSMVVAIVLIVMVASVLKARAKAGQLGPSAESREEIARLRAQVSQLNERVQVLEKLVTDPSRRLADEIERLRG